MNVNQTEIYCGFPGVGKSNISTSKIYETYKISDSDSSMFSWTVDELGKKVRNPNFPINYINHIKELIKLNYNYIFVSTHKEVIEALNEANLKFTIVYPDISLKSAYLERYKQRGNDDSFIELMNNNWDKFIHDVENAISNKKIKLLYPQQYLSDLLMNTQKHIEVN